MRLSFIQKKRYTGSTKGKLAEKNLNICLEYLHKRKNSPFFLKSSDFTRTTNKSSNKWWKCLVIVWKISNLTPTISHFSRVFCHDWSFSSYQIPKFRELLQSFESFFDIFFNDWQLFMRIIKSLLGLIQIR